MNIHFIFWILCYQKPDETYYFLKAFASFVKKMSKYNITRYGSFHNPDEEVSRTVTQRKNHHKKLLAGLTNLKKHKIQLEVTIALTKT